MSELQLTTVISDLKRWRVDPEAFLSIQLDISMIFYVGKLSSASCHSLQNDRDTWSNGYHSFKQNYSNTLKVNKTWKPEKAAFENIIRSAAVRIAATLPHNHSKFSARHESNTTSDVTRLFWSRHDGRQPVNFKQLKKQFSLAVGKKVYSVSKVKRNY